MKPWWISLCAPSGSLPRPACAGIPILFMYSPISILLLSCFLHEYNRNCSGYLHKCLMLIQICTLGKVGWNVQLALKKNRVVQRTRNRNSVFMQVCCISYCHNRRANDPFILFYVYLNSRIPCPLIYYNNPMFCPLYYASASFLS